MVNSPAALFRRYAHWDSCVSGPRQGYTNRALKSVDFNSAESIKAALEDITHMGGVDRFFDRAFHHKSKATSLLAFGILALYKHADAQSEDAVKKLTDFIHENLKVPHDNDTLIGREDSQVVSRERVASLLGESLTETAKADLLQTTESGTGLNEFSIFLADQDRCSMAGEVASAQGGVYHHRGEVRRAITAYWQAAKAFDAAAEAYEGADVNQRELAARAYKQGGDAYLKVAKAYGHEGRHDLAAQNFMNAAQAYMKGGYPDHAQRAYEQAGGAYLGVAEAYRDEGRYDLAAQAYGDVVTAYVIGHRRDLAEKAYEQVAAAHQANAQAYMDAGQHEQGKAARGKAAKAYWEAAQYYMERKRYELARDNFRRAAEAYKTLNQQKLAGDAYEMVAAALTHLAGLQPRQEAPSFYTQAAKFYTQAVKEYMAAEQPELAARAYLNVAKAFAKVDGEHAQVTEAIGSALEVYKQAVETQKVSPAEAAKFSTQAAKLYSEVGDHRAAAKCYDEGAGALFLQQMELHSPAGPAYEKAAKTFMKAAKEYMKAERHDLADLVDLANLAVRAYRNAADAYARVGGLLAQVTMALESAAEVHNRVASAHVLARDFILAARSYLEAAKTFKEAGLPTQAAAAYLQAAIAHTEADQHAQVALAYLQAAEVYSHEADQQEEAIITYMNAATAFERVPGQRAQVARALESAAEVHEGVGGFSQAAGIYEMAGQEWELVGGPGGYESAAKAFSKGAQADTQDGMDALAGRRYGLAARAYAEADLPDRAKEALVSSAEAFMKAGHSEVNGDIKGRRRADWQRHAARWYTLAETAYKDAGLLKEAAAAAALAAENNS
ncbi:soluble NSF attachment family protein [Pandoraea sputorum]|uniref:hypothetical protein n=1 Tax=Pandoraea sputorum TaxID=93222 RepID=UPI00123F5705|nr:hypothetical protein [Pandoraea sputorum]VVE59508.1 hypothetical protein PSP20601_05558 [Pandoraea sputorum]